MSLLTDLLVYLVIGGGAVYLGGKVIRSLRKALKKHKKVGVSMEELPTGYRLEVTLAPKTPPIANQLLHATIPTLENEGETSSTSER